jgi:hypothetical protein
MAMKQFRAIAVIFLFARITAPDLTPQKEHCSWRNVQIVGGGFVAGVIIHPSAPGAATPGRT